MQQHSDRVDLGALLSGLHLIWDKDFFFLLFSLLFISLVSLFHFFLRFHFFIIIQFPVVSFPFLIFTMYLFIVYYTAAVKALLMSLITNMTHSYVCRKSFSCRYVSVDVHLRPFNDCLLCLLQKNAEILLFFFCHALLFPFFQHFSFLCSLSRSFLRASLCFFLSLGTGQSSRSQIQQFSEGIPLLLAYGMQSAQKNRNYWNSQPVKMSNNEIPTLKGPSSNV